ncbi:MAG: gluconate 2-dehydrogenase subunit 3 family protein [Bacteroidota bacterium]|nr:gluconate 2-dehydrogenase subunit 3 family protein [Bacteroidota bacterium]
MWILPEQTTGFLNEIQKEQLTVLFNAILPGDTANHVPNAAKSGAIAFVDLLLARDESVFGDIPKWKALYPKALQIMQEQSVTQFNTSLKELSAEKAASLIMQLEAGALANFLFNGEKIDQPSLFDTLRRHCIQGCFSDARWGGNTNRVMWKWYGYQEETKEI